MQIELERLPEALPETGDGPSATDWLVDTLRSTRLTVLTGAPGAGKTRLLRDGVLTRLRRRTDDLATAPTGAAAASKRRRGTVRPREWVVWCDRWDGSPAEQVHACLDALTGAPAHDPGTPRPPLALRAKALSAERGARLLFIFDHGDRIAAAPSAAGGDPAAEYDALVNALCSVSPSVHLLVSARDDALPPSVQSRLAGPDARALRLPDPVEPPDATAPPAGPDARGPTVERPLQRDDVYAAIAERLGTIADREAEPAWSGAADDAASPADGSNAPPLEQPPAARADPPAFVPGSFAGASAHRARAGRRHRTALLALAFLVVAGVGAVLWQERVDSGSWPEPSERRLAAASARGRAAALATAPQLPVPTPGEAARPPPEAPATVPPPAEAPLPQASHGPGGPSDDLWRELSLQGAAGLAHGASEDPVEALAAGDRLAVVPYDALRSLAAARGTSQTARIVAPLFTDEMHVVVRADSPLIFIHQIAGRPIDLGPDAGVRHRSAVAFFQRLFDRPPTLGEARATDRDTALAELLGGAIDAIVLPEPQPSPWLASLPPVQRARLRLIGAAPGDPSTRRALRSYLPATVRTPDALPASAVHTFAVMNFLVANAATPGGRDDTAATAARALCRALPALRADGHPTWRGVDATLRLPVPLPYAPEALAVMRRCGAAARRPTAATPTTTPDRGERE